MKRVFIVHGHDLQMRDAVAEHVASLGLSPVLLSDQASQGDTVIEKFEREAKTSEYAIVLLTGDDLGGPKERVENALPDETEYTWADVALIAPSALPGFGVKTTRAAITRTRERVREIILASLYRRARQNVILELGFFISHFGRKGVCILKDPDIEEPSDTRAS